MNNLKPGLIFLSIFLAGGIAGGFVGMRLVHGPGHHHWPGMRDGKEGPRRPVEEWSKRFKQDLVDRVGVTAEQEKQLDPLMEQTQTEFRHLREESFQQAGSIVDKFDKQMLSILTPEQRPKYQQMIQERRERFKKMQAERSAHPHEPPPGMPPPPQDEPREPRPPGAAPTSP